MPGGGADRDELRQLLSPAKHIDRGLVVEAGVGAEESGAGRLLIEALADHADDHVAPRDMPARRPSCTTRSPDLAEPADPQAVAGNQAL